MGDGDKPPAETRRGGLVEGTECDVLGHGHARHGGILQWFLWQPIDLEAIEILADRLEGLVIDEHPAIAHQPLAVQHLDEGRLPVAGHARDADDLARTDLEADAVDRGLAGIVVGEDPGEIEDSAGVGARHAGGALADHRVADHQPCHAVGRHIGHHAATDERPAPQHRDGIGEGQHLAEFVADHQHREVAAARHAAQEAQHLVGFIGRQHRRGLVEDEEALVEIEQLQDLELLLLARRQAPPPARRAARGTACGP